MEKMIVYCGLNCAECPAYIATQNEDEVELKRVAREWSNEEMSLKPEDICCDGCNVEGRLFIWCGQCPIRICCRQKSFENCAYCDDFICDKLKNTFEKSPSAKKNLENIRKSIKKN
ncbi:MAG: DUF3795 domain-containing protein [Promethearchaeota archaeon]